MECKHCHPNLLVVSIARALHSSVCVCVCVGICWLTCLFARKLLEYEE